jgi:hypothetical protein
MKIASKYLSVDGTIDQLVKERGLFTGNIETVLQHCKDPDSFACEQPIDAESS